MKSSTQQMATQAKEMQSQIKLLSNDSLNAPNKLEAIFTSSTSTPIPTKVTQSASALAANVIFGSSSESQTSNNFSNVTQASSSVGKIDNNT